MARPTQHPSLSKPTKHVLILGTGGTIAGAASSGTSAIYASGTVGVDDLIRACAGVEKLAKLSFRSVLNKDSADMTLHDWQMIATEVTDALADPSIDAVVITHGTDTMEETAFFLDLVIPNGKPVVLVGAMRPSTSLSPDGPMNLFDAVAVAADGESAHRGVLVVMNNEIFLARHVTKSHTGKLNTFVSPVCGPAGQVIYGQPRYFWPPNPIKPCFAAVLNTGDPIRFPRVAVWHCHAQADHALAEIQIASESIQGLVIAGFGDGNIPASLRTLLKPAREKGIVIVRSTRVASGLVTPDYNELDSTYGLVCARALNPQKARILLMLALMESGDTHAIQSMFDCC